MASSFKLSYLLALILLNNLSVFAFSATVVGTAVHYNGSEYLDNEEKYLLSWTINNTDESIYFEVKAQTTGFVGFGISPKGGMASADILIAGMFANGTVYSGDYHGVGSSSPVRDEHSDWSVTEVTESQNYTTLHFNRKLNTCDEEDFKITDGTMRLIWALGESDTIAYHKTNRGTKSVNFYLQDENTFQPDQYQTLDLIANTVMPAEHTTYWCTFHKAPKFTQKQHIVAFDAVLNNTDALAFTHHFAVYRCLVPDNESPEEIFDPWVASEGDHCYGHPQHFPFSQYCSRSSVYIWSKGGKLLTFPPTVGFPMPEELNRQEYYALEIHYDNPDKLADRKFPTGARIYYTNVTRETDAGLLIIDHQVDPTLMVPPKVSDFVVSGHCSSNCTEKMLPDSGITIFNNLFHAHLAGRQLRLRHFRGNEELPWVDEDPFYDFNFQQNKPLTNPRKVERGDQLTVECTYDSTEAEEGKAVIGGLSTRDEMCEAIVYYYPRQPVLICGSAQSFEDHFRFLGITNWTNADSSVPGGLSEVDILEPKELAGNYRDSVSTKINWSSEFLEKYQQEKRYGEHIGQCIYSAVVAARVESPVRVRYPSNLQEYLPSDECTSSATKTSLITSWMLFGVLIMFLIPN